MADTKTTTLFRLTDVKAYVKVPAGSTEDDALLIQIADGVSERIERQTGRIFKARSISEVLSGSGTRLVLLKYRPVISITSVTIGTVTPSATTDYVVNAESG